MDAIVKKPGTGLARPRSSKGGLALINQILAESMAPLQASRRFRDEFNRSGRCIGVLYLGRYDEPAGQPPRALSRYYEPGASWVQNLEEARNIHARWLRHFAQIKKTHSELFRLLVLGKEIDPPTAVLMISVLFAALGKKKSGDENATLLATTADMFNPINDAFADITNVAPISKLPLVLALAIKKLIATAKFTSAAELRDAMMEVHRSLEIHASTMLYLDDLVERADRIMFAGDPAAWRVAYDKVDRDVMLAMRPSDEDDGDDDFPPSPRWQALNELVKAKARQAEAPTGVPVK